jgi:hypothetical protein
MGPRLLTLAGLAAAGVAVGIAARRRAREPVVEAAADQPPLVLEEFFVGETEGRGRFESRLAGVDRPFRVVTHGTWDGRTLTLEESFAFDDGERDRRTWRFTKLGPGRYEGTREDVVGKAAVWQAGPALRLSYVADLGAARLRFRDAIVHAGGDRALNRAVVSLFGVPVGTVEVTFERR